MDRKDLPIERKDFEALVHAIGFEIEHAQVKAGCCSQYANVVPLLETWHFHQIPSEPIGLGRKGNFPISTSNTDEIPRKERIFIP